MGSYAGEIVWRRTVLGVTLLGPTCESRFLWLGKAEGWQGASTASASSTHTATRCMGIAWSPRLPCRTSARSSNGYRCRSRSAPSHRCALTPGRARGHGAPVSHAAGLRPYLACVSYCSTLLITAGPLLAGSYDVWQEKCRGCRGRVHRQRLAPRHRDCFLRLCGQHLFLATARPASKGELHARPFCLPL